MEENNVKQLVTANNNNISRNSLQTRTKKQITTLNGNGQKLGLGTQG